LQPLDHIEDQLLNSTEYKVIDHRLEFMGLCPQCLEKAASRW
jgi:Fur family ferric uptake transcriptional regulator